MDSGKQSLNNNKVLEAITNKDFRSLLKLVVENPVAHVNRSEYLAKVFKVTESDIINGHLDISLKERKKVAQKQITATVRNTTVISVLTGIPGGIAIAGTIPGDIIQNMVYSIRLAQQLAYIYDFDDLIEEDGKIQTNGLLLFLGTMAGVNGSASLLRVSSSNAIKYASKQILGKPLMKTLWYPLLKKITSIVAGKTLTRKGLASGIAKIVPVVGGVTSGSITMIGMEMSAKKLNSELLRGFEQNYSERDYEKDIKIIEAEII